MGLCSFTLVTTESLSSVLLVISAIADVQERQEILTEIARGNLLDYQETGADGNWLNIGKESPNTRSIAEYER